MAALFFTFAIMSIMSLTSNGQNYVNSDNEDNEANNHGNISSCIRKYQDLQLYVLNNEDLMDSLTQLFFETGKSLTEFVRITYKFTILLPVDYYSNNSSNITTDYENEDGEFACIDSRKKFIWSNSALYLLGPEPLLWQTLFAVHVRESSITIHLPCLCSDVYNDLLSRLTYLIKIYPVMQLEGDTIQSISTYYFETKERDEDNYKSIVRIFAASIYFPCATYVVFSYLAFSYSLWIATYAIKYIKGELLVGKKDNKSSKKVGKSVSHKYESVDETSQKELSFADNSKATTERIENMSDMAANYKWHHEQRRIEIFALCLVSLILTFALIAFHIAASIKFIQYGNEVLYDDNDDYDSMDIPTPGGTGDSKVMENSDHTYNVGNDDQCVPIVYVATSFFPTISLILILIVKSIVVYYNKYKDADKSLGIFLQLSLGGFLVYLGFYFLPFMLLAFINDPIQTAFIYLIGASFILCIYLLTYSLCAFVAMAVKKNIAAVHSQIFRNKYGYAGYLCFNLGGGLSIAYFLTILIFILTLGNFHDFQAVENLTLPIVIGLLSIFVFKPSRNYVREIVKEDAITDATTNSIELKKAKYLEENDEQLGYI